MPMARDRRGCESVVGREFNQETIRESNTGLVDWSCSWDEGD